MKLNIILLFSILTFFSCHQRKEKYAILKTIKVYDFGEISINDTVNHVFEIQNLSENKLKIKQIGTNCGCTAAILSDSTLLKNEYGKIKVQFIPGRDQIGKINNSIVIEGNTNPPYTVIYLKGVVK